MFNDQVKSVEDMKKVMRYHNVTNMCDTICPRCDLVQDWAFGGVDAKVTDLNLLKLGRSHLISGPPVIEGVSTPFQFSGTKFENVSHFGIQDYFNNSWIEA